MKSRSIAGFVLGLVPGLILGFVSFYLIIVFGAVDSIAEAGGAGTYYTLLAWCFMIGSILSIVGASLCFTKARIGGVIMLVATVLLSVLPIYAFSISEHTIELSMIMLLIVPIICVLVGAILAMRAKRREPQLSPAVQNVPVNNVVAQKQFCKYCGAKVQGTYCSNCGAKQE